MWLRYYSASLGRQTSLCEISSTQMAAHEDSEAQSSKFFRLAGLPNQIVERVITVPAHGAHRVDMSNVSLR